MAFIVDTTRLRGTTRSAATQSSRIVSIPHPRPILTRSRTLGRSRSPTAAAPCNRSSSTIPIHLQHPFLPNSLCSNGRNSSSSSFHSVGVSNGASATQSSRGSLLPCKYRGSDKAANPSNTVTTSTPTTSSSSTAAGSSSSTPAGYRGTAVVVGAGPAGTTAAMYLAKAGYQVHVLERRGHPGKMEADIKRTYLIGLGERGLSALDGLDISVPLNVGRPMKGSVYAYKSGKRVEDPFTPATRIVGVDRQGLAAFLVEQAQQRFPNAITFHWHTQPTEFDFKGRTLRCRKSESGTGNGASDQDELPPFLTYDLLIGADGAASNVRAALVDAVPGMKIEQLTSPVAEMEYKAFHNLPWNDAIKSLLPKYSSSGSSSSGSSSSTSNAAADRAAQKEAATAAAVAAVTTQGTPAVPAAAAAAGRADVHGLGEGMTFFAFNNPQPNQPSPGSITLYLNAQGLWSGTVYQPPGKYEAMHGDVAAHETAIRQFTPDTFPADWVPEMAQQMADVKPSRINPMRLVSDLAAPSLGVVLLGDAAHNVTPQMGQGCNSALEDAALLDKALSSSNYDIKSGLHNFEKQRKPQVHALQRMEEENSWVRRPARLFQDPLDKTLARFAWISFFMLLPLLRLLPGMKQYVHASLFQTIMSTTIPYNKLHRAIKVAPFVMLGLLGGVVYGLYWVLKEGICLGLKAMRKL